MDSNLKLSTTDTPGMMMDPSREEPTGDKMFLVEEIIPDEWPLRRARRNKESGLASCKTKL